MPTFDIEAARKDGLPDDQILQYLGKVKGFDVDSAVKEGANKEQLLNYLSINNKPTDRQIVRGQEIEPQEPNFQAMIKRAETPMIDLNKTRKSDYKYLETPVEVPEAAPSWAKSYPSVYDKIVKTKDIVSPTVQSLANYGGMALGPLGSGFMNMQEQSAEDIFDVYMGRKKAPTLGENLKRMGGNFAWGKLGQDLTRWGAERIKRPTPEALEAERQAKEIGVNPLPSEIRESKTLGNLEAGMGRLLGSSSILTDYDRKNVRAIIQEAKNIAETSGKKIQPEDLGRIIYDKVDDYLTRFVTRNETELTKLRTGIKDTIGSSLSPIKLSEETSSALFAAKKTKDATARNLYQERDALIPKKGVPLKNTLKTAEHWKAEIDKRMPSEVNSTLYQRIQSIIDFSKEKIPKAEDTIESLWEPQQYRKIIPKGDVAVINELKSNISADLNKLYPWVKSGEAGVRGIPKPGESFAIRAYANLRNSIEKDINAYSRQSGSGLAEATKNANTYYSEWMTLQKKLQPLLKTDATKVLDRIDDVADVRLIKKAVGEEKFNTLIKPAFTNRLLGEEGQLLNPEYTQKALSKYIDVLPEVYNEQELGLLKDSVTKGLKFTGNPMNKVDTAFLKKIVERTDPKDIIDSFYTTGKSKYAAHNFRLVYHIMGREKDKIAQAKMRYFLTNKILFDGQKIDPTSLLTGSKEYGGFNFDKLSKNIQNNEHLLKMMTGKEGFNPESIDKLKRLVNIGKYMQSIGKYAPMAIKETGQSTWALSQLGVFGTALAYGNVPKAMVALFGPAATTYVYTKEPIKGLITHGLPQTGMLKGLGLRSTRLLNQEQNQEQE